MEQFDATEQWHQYDFMDLCACPWDWHGRRRGLQGLTCPLSSGERKQSQSFQLFPDIWHWFIFCQGAQRAELFATTRGPGREEHRWS